VNEGYVPILRVVECLQPKFVRNNFKVAISLTFPLIFALKLGLLPFLIYFKYKAFLLILQTQS